MVTWVAERIKWIMVVSGMLTCTMVYAMFAPQAALRSAFGDSLEGPMAEIIVRNWGALVALVGAMLLYGAYDRAARSVTLIVAGLSKLVFITLVLVHGRQYLGNQVGIAITIDLIMVILFATYLVGTRRVGGAASQPAEAGSAREVRG